MILNTPHRLAADLHVHSTFSDGRGTLEENIAAAEARGLTELGLVDHVRVSTPWVPRFGRAVALAAMTTELELTCGVEAKILDLDGHLDLPPSLPGVHRVLAADHQMPGPNGPLHPNVVKEGIRTGRARGSSVVEGLVTATVAAMERRSGLVLAHLFSLLPKVDLSEDDVTDEQIHRLADAALASRATLEVSERWRCPSLRVVLSFLDAGVPVVASTDAHTPDAIGRYGYVADVLFALSPALAGREVA